MTYRSDRAIRAGLAASIARGIATRAAANIGKAASFAGVGDFETAHRCAAELEQRRHRPNPHSRPPADQSAALKALRKSLARACSEPERVRLQRLIDGLAICYRPAEAAGRRSAKRRTRHKTPQRATTRQRPVMADCAA